MLILRWVFHLERVSINWNAVRYRRELFTGNSSGPQMVAGAKSQLVGDEKLSAINPEQSAWWRWWRVVRSGSPDV